MSGIIGENGQPMSTVKQEEVSTEPEQKVELIAIAINGEKIVGLLMEEDRAKLEAGEMFYLGQPIAFRPTMSGGKMAIQPMPVDVSDPMMPYIIVRRFEYEMPVGETTQGVYSKTLQQLEQMDLEKRTGIATVKGTLQQHGLK